MIWDPFKEMRKLHQEMENMFRNYETRLPALTGREVAFRAPVSDIVETENNIIATFELPGVDKKDIELNVTENSIEVKVEKKAEKEIKKKESYAYEKRRHSYYRMMSLPAEVIPQKTEAVYKNGILRVEIPKTKVAKEKKKKIEVK